MKNTEKRAGAEAKAGPGTQGGQAAPECIFTRRMQLIAASDARMPEAMRGVLGVNSQGTRR